MEPTLAGSDDINAPLIDIPADQRKPRPRDVIPVKQKSLPHDPPVTHPRPLPHGLSVDENKSRPQGPQKPKPLGFPAEPAPLVGKISVKDAPVPHAHFVEKKPDVSSPEYKPTPDDSAAPEHKPQGAVTESKPRPRAFIAHHKPHPQSQPSTDPNLHLYVTPKVDADLPPPSFSPDPQKAAIKHQPSFPTEQKSHPPSTHISFEPKSSNLSQSPPSSDQLDTLPLCDYPAEQPLVSGGSGAAAGGKAGERRPGSKRRTVAGGASRSKAEEAKRAAAERRLRIEKRLLLVAFGVGVLSSVMFLVAITTEHWVTVQYPTGLWDNDTERGVVFYRAGQYYGLWRHCSREYYNKTGQIGGTYEKHCQVMAMFPSESELGHPRIDTFITHYRRSCCAIGIIALVVSVFAHAATWYSINRLRYIYKRLAGVLHLITGACCWVTVEVFHRSVQYERDYLQQNVPPKSSIEYGFSYYLGWVCFALFLLAGLVLLACSRKRKGARARSLREAQENEPVNIGRI